MRDIMNWVEALRLVRLINEQGLMRWVALVVATLTVWLIVDRIFFLRKSFILFLIGGLIGFLPRLFYNAAFSFSSLTIHGSPITEHISLNFSTFAKRLYFLIT